MCGIAVLPLGGFFREHCMPELNSTDAKLSIAHSMLVDEKYFRMKKVF